MSSSLNVYFGGSFFPPHIGHDQMLCHLLGHSDVKSVVLVPTFQNPLKAKDFVLLPTAALKHQFIDAWMLSMHERGVSGLEKLRVDWREVASETVSYTVDTLAEVIRDSASESSKENSKEEWALCVGDDCLPDLMKWRDVEKLLGLLAEFWVFRRDRASSLNLIEKIPSELRAKCVWRYMLPEIAELSSTQLRELLKEGDARQETLNALLLPEVSRLLVEMTTTS